jgi:hypothetical protein
MRKSIAPEQIAGAILILRGQSVLQDSALAALIGAGRSPMHFSRPVSFRRGRGRS